jgi:2-oxoglutarate dehydrogenase E2 component (dihydrolipoamide succinyltransferase)
MAEVKVPEVGESITEVFIGSWLKNEGEAVAKDEPLVEIETDKATLEVPAPISGTLTGVSKKQGDAATVGEVIAQIDTAGAVDAPANAEADTAEPDTAEPATEIEAPKREGNAAPEMAYDPEPGEATEAQAQKLAANVADTTPAEPHIMPAAQRLLDEHGLLARDVRATGPGGRLLKEDVQRAVAEQQGAEQRGTEPQSKPVPQEEPAPAKKEAPAQTPSASGDRQEEAVPMSPLRRRIAERLVEAQATAALLTTFNEVDMSAVMALRSEYKEAFQERYEGTRLGFMSFFVKAVIDALKLIPQLNAEIRENQIVYKNYYDIGVAVSSKKGLLVPVVRNAERLSFAELERAISDFGRRAQSNKIAPEELQGGTFTISNGGVFGSLMSTPIVNPPQSGVLGMHGIFERPIALNGQVVIRPMMYIALTYDHRIVDGREAVTFLKRVKDAVENPARMLLEV